MYPRLIEVHNGHLPFTVNIDSIKFVCPHPEFLANGEIHYIGDRIPPTITEESYDVLRQLLIDAGCHIEKPDPRMDNNPLAMDDFDSVIKDEPIWSSNDGKWYLVHAYAIGGIWLVDRYKNEKFISNDDLEEYPLYRMKVE